MQLSTTNPAALKTHSIHESRSPHRTLAVLQADPAPYCSAIVSQPSAVDWMHLATTLPLRCPTLKASRLQQLPKLFGRFSGLIRSAHVLGSGHLNRRKTPFTVELHGNESDDGVPFWLKIGLPGHHRPTDRVRDSDIGSQTPHVLDLPNEAAALKKCVKELPVRRGDFLTPPGSASRRTRPVRRPRRTQQQRPRRCPYSSRPSFAAKGHGWQSHRQGSIIKAGNTHTSRALVEGAWAYRFTAQTSRHLQLRLAKPPPAIQDISWKAQMQLCQRCRRLMARGKNPN
jgi:hypothetical protein